MSLFKRGYPNRFISYFNKYYYFCWVNFIEYHNEPYTFRIILWQILYELSQN